MSDAQTEAPAEVGGLWAPANPEHAKLGWSYDFEQTERIARAAYDSTGYDATMEVVEFVMAEADRRHAAALAAKDAELDGAAFLKDAAEAALRKREVEINKLHAHLAEARKALEEIDDARAELGTSHDYSRGWNDALFRVRQIARRALTGGQEDGQ